MGVLIHATKTAKIERVILLLQHKRYNISVFSVFSVFLNVILLEFIGIARNLSWGHSAGFINFFLGSN